MKHLEAFTHEVGFPDKDLADFVSHFWCSKWPMGIQECFNYHSTANTNTELVFAFAPGQQPVFSTLQGHTANFCCLQTGGLSEMFGVSFYAYAIPYFFEASAFDVLNQLVDFKEIIKFDAAIIIDELACAGSFTHRIEIMTRYLKNKFNLNRKQDGTMVNAIKTIRKLRGQVNIKALANNSSLSQKQFERRFKTFAGFNPKLYSRILRFENSLFPYQNNTSLTDKALDLGYYDQAHFINDFKQFSGFSPSNYTPIS
ncbi:MAG TPA: helix-turn-helix domain-containing protein [Pseudosphingobacterium sp.]|nr:helix-turn-helix domain-containing protein [Pseudosphingobacterium sp.]